VERMASPQVERSHYFGRYDSFGRFASYWHQIEETGALGGRILEVGIGNGTVAAVLRARGFDVTTVDIDPQLNPGVVADVRKLPFAAGAFDTVLVAEVLEHIPWEDVPVALGEIARVATRGVVASVPNADVALTLQAYLPNAIQILRMALRRRLPLRHALWALSQRGSWRRSGGLVRELAEVGPLHSNRPPACDQHFWELGLNGVGKDEFLAVLEACNLGLVRDFRAPEFPYHHFFVLVVGTDRVNSAE
jgi:SAM-dependent methyltransferase